MAFVKFTKTKSRVGRPKVSMWSRGQIAFNQAVVLENNLNKFKYVVLYYDPEAKKIGMEFTNDKAIEGAIKLIIRKESGFSFTAISFYNANKIEFRKKTQSFILSYDEQEKLFVIDLNKPIN